MGFIQGEGHSQGTLFPVVLVELVPDDHVCSAIDAFVDTLEMADLGFERASAETGRPGCDPQDLIETIFVQLFESDSPFSAFGDGVPPQCRVDVVALPALYGP
jgi:hypothetical protein